MTTAPRKRITQQELDELREALTPLVGVQLEVLKIPRDILAGFEPSQIGTIVGALVDACLPQLQEILPNDETLRAVGLTKHAGILGEREGYPDFQHVSGKRLELKGLYVDPKNVRMKKPPTPREPSARLTQKVTVKNVDPGSDALLVVAYQLQPNRDDPNLFSPTIIDLVVFSVIECIEARDERLLKKQQGRWFGDYETPTVLSKVGKRKRHAGLPLDTTTYGRKASEGKDYNEDTNFGKLARIPYPPLQSLLARYGVASSQRPAKQEPVDPSKLTATE